MTSMRRTASTRIIDGSGRTRTCGLVEVVLLRADDGRGDEVAVARRRVLHQVTAEQLTDERLKHDVRGEDGLAPVVDGGELLGGLPYPLPSRILVPRRKMRGAVEA